MNFVAEIFALLLTFCQIAAASYEKQLLRKCETIPHRTFFDPRTLSCYVQSDYCENLHYLRPRYPRLSSSEVRMLRNVGISEQRGDVCVFGFNPRCYDGDQFGDKCFIVSENDNSCSSESYEFVPHSDREMRNVMKFMEYARYSYRALGTGIRYRNGNLKTGSNEEKLDYLRWSPERSESSKNSYRMVIYTDNSGQAGYMGAPMSSNYRMLCYNYIEADHIYQPPYQTTTTRRTTTPTTTPTTTTLATTTPGYEIAREYILRTACTTNKLHRLVLNGLHRYYIDFRKYFEAKYYNPGQHTDEAPVGYVVTDDIWQKISSKCPALRRFYVYYHTSNKATYISSTSLSSIYEEVGAFYCAEREGYCGANFQLVQLSRRPELGVNNFFPSSDTELYQQASNNSYFQQGQETKCWIWH